MNIGDKAPEILGKDEQGREIRLSDYKGRKLVLYFYPKDNTSGCTKQACAFRDLYPQFREAGAVILGVSKDTVASHKKFQQNHGLPFTLLSDPQFQVIKAYDVYKESVGKTGKINGGLWRSTYLIDENGMIVRAHGKVKAAENPAQMLQEVR